jgi:hypothetical protein
MKERYKQTKEHKEKRAESRRRNGSYTTSAMKGKFSANPKDKKAKAIHMWIKYYKGNPQICVDCGITTKEKKLQWSNVNHKYQRKLDDYAARCPKCHKKFDMEYNNYEVKGTFKPGKDIRRENTQFKINHKKWKHN